MKYFNKLISHNNTDLFITPNSFHYFVDYVFITNNKSKIKKLNLLTEDKISLVKDYDKILIDCLDFNKMTIKDNLIDKINKKIILITAREHLPQVQKNKFSDYVLNHKNVILWFSQNPIYPNSDKYFAIPYGLRSSYLKEYTNILKKNISKNKNVSNLPVGIHKHLPKNHIRRVYNELGKNLNNKISLDNFYQIVAKSKFLISTSGDREDCYRHYEAIGLGTIPISNVSENYKYIFGDNMIYKNGDEMIKLLKDDCKNLVYQEPNKDLICKEYHFDFVREKIEKKIKELI